MATYEDLPVDVRVLAPGDLVELEERDQNPDNREVWRYEMAEVEAVSTHDRRSGGWCDALAVRGTAVIYTTNGAGPSLVTDHPDRKRRHPRH